MGCAGGRGEQGWGEGAQVSAGKTAGRVPQPESFQKRLTQEPHVCLCP